LIRASYFVVEVYGDYFGLSRDILHLFCVENRWLAIRLEVGGGSVVALLRNQIPLGSRHPARGHLLAQFTKTSLAHLKLASPMTAASFITGCTQVFSSRTAFCGLQEGHLTSDHSPIHPSPKLHVSTRYHQTAE
jgi:hypothetical protein